ncbi:MAG: protein phosphatase CheZ [Nitrospirae bacterium]|nr:protein phosphatase CheZ [Nitrospirota bacterium]
MQYIGFVMNNSEYTIPILKVQEIINLPVVTKLPQAPPYMEGISNLRGKIVPIVNLKRLVGLTATEAGQKAIIVSSGRITFGVLVDDITGVITIDDSAIEPAESFMSSHIEQVEGVAKVDDKLVVILDTKKLIPVEDVSMFEDEIFEVKEQGDKVEVIKKIEGMGGQMQVKEVMDAKEFAKKMGINKNDPRYAVFDELVGFMDAMGKQEFDAADNIMQSIMNKSQGDLFKEVGKVTRKLHDAIKSFKDALDPKLKSVASVEMPSAIDKLQHVIEKTEEAVNKTMGIVEKYIMSIDTLSSHIKNIKGPEESVSYLREFQNSFEDDMTEILTTQAFQDITGQTIKKVIRLVGDVEEELVRLISTFGVKFEQGALAEVAAAEQVSQSGVDDLLKEFGF